MPTPENIQAALHILGELRQGLAEAAAIWPAAPSFNKALAGCIRTELERVEALLRDPDRGQP